VYLEYHYRTRYSSVEFFCNVYYRLQSSIMDSKLKLSTPQGPRKMNGFHPLLQMGLADMPPGRRWRAIEERTFDISASQVRVLHCMLFGESSSSESTALAEKISMREMLRLMLASVGISFYASSDPDDEGDADAFTMGKLRWEGIERSQRWIGRNIRDFSDEDEDGFGRELGPNCRHQ
jgi:hypothetical protein